MHGLAAACPPGSGSANGSLIWPGSFSGGGESTLRGLGLCPDGGESTEGIASWGYQRLAEVYQDQRLTWTATIDQSRIARTTSL